MCPADSGGLPDTYSIISKLDNRFGVTVEQALIRVYQTSWITADDLNNITNGGFNLVRVPVWWGNFYSITNTTSSGWRSDAFSELDWVVTNCASRGIYVVIDMHGVIGGQSTSDDTGEENVNAYWTNAVDQSETAYMWTQIASHYATNTAVAGYDLINEPYQAPSNSAVLTAYNNLYNTVRAVDANHMSSSKARLEVGIGVCCPRPQCMAGPTSFIPCTNINSAVILLRSKRVLTIRSPISAITFPGMSPITLANGMTWATVRLAMTTPLTIITMLALTGQCGLTRQPPVCFQAAGAGMIPLIGPPPLTYPQTQRLPSPTTGNSGKPPIPSELTLP